MLRNQRGHIDTQFPAFVLGFILTVAVAHLLSRVEAAATAQMIAVWAMLGLALLVFVVGFIINVASLSYPESPFNKHSPPLGWGIMVAGVCGYAAWKLHATAHQAVFWTVAVEGGLSLIWSAVAQVIGSRMGVGEP